MDVSGLINSLLEHPMLLALAVLFASPIVLPPIIACLELRNDMMFRKFEKKRLDWVGQKKLLRAGNAALQEWEAWLAAGQELLAICDKRRLRGHDWGRAEVQIREEIRPVEVALSSVSMHAQVPSPNQPDLIVELATLRSDGRISGEEFDAFTERFRRSSGSKAREIIQAIEELHRQHKSGAMTQGNYKASLWMLMDRLDRELK